MNLRTLEPHFLSSEYAWMADVPYNCTFWLMSDNLLAKYALEPWNRSLSNSIDVSLDRFGYNETTNRSRLWEVCFGYDIPNQIKDGNSYCVSYNLDDYAIFVELHNSSTPMIIEDYADLLCFHALDLLWEGNRSGAEHYLRLGYRMGDGKGFYDASTEVNGVYSNYKKGIFLFTAKILSMGEKFPKYDDIEYMLWTQLNPASGGITSLMDSNGRQLGSANCETSSWCLMVYNNALITKLRSKYDTPIGLNKSFDEYVVIGVFLFVMILYSFYRLRAFDYSE